MKPLSAELNSINVVNAHNNVVKIVNYIKMNVLNSKKLSLLCVNMKTDDKQLLPHAQL